MKILFYLREKCKYGMVVATDDENIAEIFKKRYFCTEILLENFNLVTTENDFREFFGRVQKKLPKETAAFCYNSSIKKVFYMESATTPIHIVDFSMPQDFVPIQVLENLLYLTLIPEDSVLALHGAAIAKNGKAYLFLASTTCGKSTLTAFLWKKAGYEYITDDEIFISREDRCVLPVRKNLSLRQGGYDLLEIDFENKYHVNDGKTNTYLIVPQEELRLPKYEIEKIIFLEGYGSDEPYFTKIEPREAFSKLLRGQLSSKNSVGNIAEKYKILTELAQKSYEMRYSDLWTAKKYLEH